MAKKTPEQPSERSCATCGDAIGDKCLPVLHDGSWHCPQCFVHVIAPASEGRFTGLHAVRCERCLSVFLAHGPKCPQCRYTVLTALSKR